VTSELLLGSFQGLGDPAERDIEALGEASRVDEGELSGLFVIALAQTAIFEDRDLLAGGVAELAAHEAAKGPAHARVGAAEAGDAVRPASTCPSD
jgi:hypothetical protein